MNTAIGDAIGNVTGTTTGVETGMKELALQLQLFYNNLDRELWIYLPVVRLF
jgi:hypothetical protein